MLKKTFIPCYIKIILQFKNMKSQQNNLTTSICIKNEDLMGDNITIENEGVVECGNGFKICKIIRSKQ